MKIKDSYDEMKKKAEKPNKLTTPGKTLADIEAIKSSLQAKIDKILDYWTSQISSTTLTIPKLGENLVLATDASGTGIGWSLTLESTGEIVEIGGRQFKDQETRYTVLEVELMAAAEALNKLKLFITRAEKITLLTDNKCALGLINSSKKAPSDRAFRFLTQIMETRSLVAKYINTKDNGAADGISRDLLNTVDLINIEKDELDNNLMAITSEDSFTDVTEISSSKNENLYQNTIKSPAENVSIIINIHELIHEIESGQVETRASRKNLIKKLAEKLDSSVKTEIETKDQFVQTMVDRELLENLVMKTHTQYLHLGQRRLRKILSLLFPLHHFGNELLQKVCKSCSICAERQRLASKGSVGKMYIPSRPNEVIHLDHVTPFPNVASINKKTTILSMKDSFTKFVTLVPCRTYSHVEIVDALRTYIGTHGRPTTIRVDNALTSHELERFCNLMNIKLQPTPIYRPQANGQIERIHRELRRYIKDTLQAMDMPLTRWVEVIPFVMNIINSTPHTTTGYTPEELQIGRYTQDVAPPPQKELLDKYRQVKIKLEKLQDLQSKPVAGPFPTNLLKKGDKVFIVIPEKHTNVPAEVIKDFGEICLLKKSERGRFQFVSVHKSLIVRRNDEVSLE